MLEPHTSLRLRVLKRNNLKDFVVNSQSMGVTHLLVLSRSELSLNLRLIRNPQGPTLWFRVENYSLSKDILASQKRPIINEELFLTAPLLVMTGFGSGQQSGKEEDGKRRHLGLVQMVVQNMFPPIDVDTVKLSALKRVVLIDYDEESGLLDFRH
jgi:ribosome biogenesis protein SSF1/2